MRAMGVGLVGALLLLSGCVSSRVVQRDGCWVRETKTFPGQVREELGPCERPKHEWAKDRLARLVQECIAQSDYRWQNRAIAAWNKGEPLPEQAPEEIVARQCMDQAVTAMIPENEALKKRLAEVSGDREALASQADDANAFIQESHERVATALGEAARKPAPNAVATATSSGTATTNTQSDMETRSPAAQPATVVTQPATIVTQPILQPAPRESVAERAPAKSPKAKPAKLDGPAAGCDLKTSPSVPVEKVEGKVVAAAPKPTEPVKDAAPTK